MDDRPAFLGVSCSVTGRRWVGPNAEIERKALRLSQLTGLPDIVARMLAGREVEPEEAAAYLAPTLRDLMPDPSVLADLDLAADRIAAAALNGERVAVFGDYDVDGAASVALLIDWFGTFGVKPTTYIPDRIEEGYGPNDLAMRSLGKGHDLVVCVDCGTLSIEEIAVARAENADAIVLDHHLPGSELPPATVVNPNRADDTSGLGYLCAAGVVFLVLVAANRMLRERGKKVPELLDSLDLVALATVADVAPMIGLNRALVRTGIKVLAQRRRPGLRALADVSRLNAPPTSRDLGFAFGPRINAGGRIGSADLGTRLLTTADDAEAAALAEKLERLNGERRDVEAAVLDAALLQVEQRGAANGLVWAAGDGWHPGVVGIVASRLKEQYNRPAVVIALSGDEGRGSARSVAGIDLGSVISNLAERGVLARGGGHKMAAGLTVARERIDEAMTMLDELLVRLGVDAASPCDLQVVGAIEPAAATLDFAGKLDSAGPFGPSNPAPSLVVVDVVPVTVRTVGAGHCQARLKGKGKETLDAIAFGAEQSGMSDFLSAAAQARKSILVAGRLEIDDWGGRRRPKLRLEDASDVGKS